MARLTFDWMTSGFVSPATTQSTWHKKASSLPPLVYFLSFPYLDTFLHLGLCVFDRKTFLTLFCVCVCVCGLWSPEVGSPSVRSMRRDAEPSLGCAFSIRVPSNTALLMSVAEMKRKLVIVTIRLSNVVPPFIKYLKSHILFRQFDVRMSWHSPDFPWSPAQVLVSSEKLGCQKWWDRSGPPPPGHSRCGSTLSVSGKKNIVENSELSFN